MGSKYSASCGGKAMAIIAKKKAIDGYYKSPNICKQCGKIIPVIKKASQTRHKKFCNHKCAAVYSNMHRMRKPPEPSKCIHCNIEIPRTIYSNGRVSPKRKVCDPCIVKSKTRVRNPVAKAESWGDHTTKGEIFAAKKGYTPARALFQRHARRRFLRANIPMVCRRCGYDKYVEVSHIIPVAKFNGSATLGEINNINNLEPLCPNCHWEKDNIDAR